jgi:VanW like protein
MTVTSERPVDDFELPPALRSRRRRVTERLPALYPLAVEAHGIRRKGYVDGMLLDNGEATAGVGGGICQLANLLHWMVLHSPLVITERSEHSFDPFPDNGRVLPWGVGCTI